MKYFRVHVVLFIIALTILVGVVAFETRSSRGQSQSPRPDSRVKPTVLITDRHDAVAENASSKFTAAAARNVLLQNELTWTFGGKQQRGWYLYNSLIDQLLNTESEVPSSNFAAALAGWQKKIDLEPSGVLDETSLKAMVSDWQSNRLKNRA